MTRSIWVLTTIAQKNPTLKGRTFVNNTASLYTKGMVEGRINVTERLRKRRDEELRKDRS